MTYQRLENETWLARKKRERGERAVERQLDFQKMKSKGVAEDSRFTSIRIAKKAHLARQKIEKFRTIEKSDSILEVGSGAHGLVFGFEENFGIGLDPLAVDYRRLFPDWQADSNTVAAVGEQLPFADGSIDVVLSDNVIDHAADPVGIIYELVRVLHPDGILYFTVNTHHPIYEPLSKLHGWWNAIGIKYEITPFADHTIHFTESSIMKAFEEADVEILSNSPGFDKSKYEPNDARSKLEYKLKKLFFKNSLFEIIATKK